MSEPGSQERVEYVLDDGVATIELVRPGGNALDLRMGEAFERAARTLVDDVEAGRARVAVVRARGRMFSAGGDLADIAAAPDRGEHVTAIANLVHAGIALIRGLSIPVVSVIQGTTAGGGLGVALAGDVVIAADEAKLLFAYTAAGLTPDCGASWILPDRLSWPRVMDLALTNRAITGREAAEWGLVSRAVPAAELDDAVASVVDGLRAGPANAFATTKRLMRESRDRGLVASMKVEAVEIAAAVAGAEGSEGVDAFLAKRRPEFRRG
ncbi:enoyl-CoA hydratase-related protein [Tsukamurella sp. PLM1]|uniref:enoyl-CoA hydratase-related protein n=1 Tax=Tsukamurella sp. PLM1 TaxID=2929795 RepID=UPI00204AAEDA|nr:enoyl-CoA hydratase-related protein [Tsukamurella sp. PLM1]BDH58040.1 enoyl-CoA hydratase [Tsukamurella sp. PLM1]